MDTSQEKKNKSVSKVEHTKDDIEKQTDDPPNPDKYEKITRLSRPNTVHGSPLDMMPATIREEMRHKMTKKCNKCSCVKPPRSHHCSTCGRCILKMDHHCPWMNNCIGLRNQKAFILFNFYTFVVTAWTVARVGYVSFMCMGEKTCDRFELIPGLHFITAVIMIFCVLFALFTIIMFFDQL